MVRKFFGDVDPIGKKMGYDTPARSRGRRHRARRADRRVTRSRRRRSWSIALLRQNPDEFARNLYVRVIGPADGVKPALARAIATAEPNLAVREVVSLAELTERTVVNRASDFPADGGVRPARRASSRASVSTRPCRTRSRGAPTRSASAWRSAPRRRRCADSCCARRCARIAGSVAGVVLGVAVLGYRRDAALRSLAARSGRRSRDRPEHCSCSAHRRPGSGVARVARRSDDGTAGGVDGYDRYDRYDGYERVRRVRQYAGTRNAVSLAIFTYSDRWMASDSSLAVPVGLCRTCRTCLYPYCPLERRTRRPARSSPRRRRQSRRRWRRAAAAPPVTSIAMIDDVADERDGAVRQREARRRR